MTTLLVSIIWIMIGIGFWVLFYASSNYCDQERLKSPFVFVLVVGLWPVFLVWSMF